MCFSASASFGAGAVLTLIGVVTILKTHRTSQLLFAGIPLIFGIQQIAEGVLWLTLPNAGALRTQRIFTYLFLFFAQVVWPIWVPLAILLLENQITRKSIQRLLVATGMVIGIYLAYCLVSFPVHAVIQAHHILYVQDYPFTSLSFSTLLYAIATVLPPFFSHVKKMWMLGATIFLAYVVTLIFYEQYVLSVWCFFSSIISLSIYAIMLEISHKKTHAMLSENHYVMKR